MRRTSTTTNLRSTNWTGLWLPKKKKDCEPLETTDAVGLRCRGKLFCPFHGKAAVRCSPDKVQKQEEEDSVAGPKCEGNNPVKRSSHLLPSR